jgi:hypothetical protein
MACADGPDGGPLAVKRIAPKRTAWAIALSLALHVLALTGMVIGLKMVSAPPEGRTMELRLIAVPEFKMEPQPSRRSVAHIDQARPREPQTMAMQPSSETPDAAQVTAPTTGTSDCEPEDLPLLTDAEKVLCRNQIDADKARRAARTADERLAKQIASLKDVPHIDRIPPEKRAYYDAVVAAYKSEGHGPGITCGGKPPHSLQIGPLPCFITPPHGFLTEELDLPDPTDIHVK